MVFFVFFFFGCSFFFSLKKYFFSLKKNLILTHILDFVNLFWLTSYVFSMLTCLIGIFHQWKDGRDVQLSQ